MEQVHSGICEIGLLEAFPKIIHPDNHKVGTVQLCVG